MSKHQKRVRRADAGYEDHVHMLPNGELTGCSLHKPSKDQFDMHSHLYEHEEDTCETQPMHSFGDHTHTMRWQGEIIQTSGPMAPPKAPGEPWQKMDSIERRGRQFVLKTPTGRILSRGATAIDCMKRYDHDDQYDEAFAKHAVGDVDEGLWSKGKEASQKAFGHIKWPFVQWWYKNQGGK